MLRTMLVFWLSATSILAEPLAYPPMKHSDVVDDYFGTKIPDPYRWLEEIDSPKVAIWAKAENDSARSYLGKLPDRAYFSDRFTRLAKVESYSIPTWTGSRYFYFRHEGLQNHAVLYTTKTLAEEPRVAIDPNEFSADGTVALGGFGASHDGNLLAYGISRKGSDWNEIRVRDLESGKDFADVLKWVKFSALSWTNDSKGFFYSRFTEPKPTENQTFAYLHDQKVYYHRIGDPQDKDQVIYERPDHPEWLCSAVVLIDGTDLFLSVFEGGAGRNQLYFKNLGGPLAPKLDAPFIPIVDQFEARFTPIEKVGKRLFVQTDKDAPKNKLISIDLESPGQANWKEILPESKNVLQTAGLTGGKLAVIYVVDATDRPQIYDLEGKFEKEIQLPALGSISGLDWAPERSGKQGRSTILRGQVSGFSSSPPGITNASPIPVSMTDLSGL